MLTLYNFVPPRRFTGAVFLLSMKVHIGCSNVYISRCKRANICNVLHNATLVNILNITTVHLNGRCKTYGSYCRCSPRQREERLGARAGSASLSLTEFRRSSTSTILYGIVVHISDVCKWCKSLVVMIGCDNRR